MRVNRLNKKLKVLELSDVIKISCLIGTSECRESKVRNSKIIEENKENADTELPHTYWCKL